MVANPISTSKLIALTKVLAVVKDGALWVILFCDTVTLAVEELERVRSAVRRNHKPLDWNAFLKDLEKTDWLIGEQMQKLKCTTFELGRLILEAPDAETATLLRVFTSQLKKELTKAYGINFKVKILEL